MIEINIGMNREKALEVLNGALTAAQSTTEGVFEFTIYGEFNGPSGEEVKVVISNDDMEDREEVAERILVDVERD